MIRTTMAMKKRMMFLLIACSVLLFALILRTGYWQLVRGDQLQLEAIEQQTRDRMINSKRGSILDRNGKPLAVSASVETVTASPAEVQKNSDEISVEKVAQGLADIMELEYDSVYQKLSQQASYVILKRKIEKEEADKVRAFISENKVSGINLDADTKRFYPYGSFASHVIGFTGTDNQGLTGIELMYDKYLKGSPGRVISAKNAAGIEMPFEYEKMVDAEDGLNVVLTIDENIQRFAEKHLETAVVENKLGNGAACIVMEVETGDILAMATKPDFDLNSPFTLTDEVLEEIQQLPEEEQSAQRSAELEKMWRNKAVVDTYEPGSTFKIFTSAMAIEEGVVADSDTFYCPGYKVVGPHTIHCWKSGGHGSQGFAKAVQNSCNPAFMEIGARVGREKFYQYVKGFGFRERTGIDLPGEAIGLIQDFSGFNEVELATSSFGQGFTITPLQMITAVNAVANNGRMLRPRLVKALTDQEGNVVQEFEPSYVRQIISEETSRKLRDILESVVSEGSGSGAYIKGYRVAGKTGTSEKTPRGNGKYIASFVGMAPADNPKVVCLVLLDEPNGDSHFGGVIASPVVRNIMDDTLHYLEIEPSYTIEELATIETTVPDFTGMTLEEAKKAAADANLKYNIEGSGETVLNQIPKLGIKVNQQSTVMLYTEEKMKNTTTTVPNLLNMTVGQAAAAISQAGLNINIVGAGATPATTNVISYKQSAEAGSVVEIGTTVTVEFKRIEAGE